MLRVDLPDVVTSDLHECLSGLPVPPGDPEALLAHLLRAAALLPVEAVQTVLSFRSDPRAAAALLITGMPIDHDLPPTPVEWTGAQYKSGKVSERAALLVAALLGEPVAYLAEKGGRLVQDVFPIPAERHTPSNEGSAAPLGFHTELVFSPAAPERPFHRAAPDFVLLLGLRCPPERVAATLFVEAKSLCDRLSERHLECLRQPNYQLVAPYSFTRGGNGRRPSSPPVPLLRGPADSPALAFDSACGVRAASEPAREALTALIDACADPAVQESVQLGAGDLLVLNNNRCAHARSAFPASFDGRDRWLQRVYVRHRIWPLPAVCPDSFRVLA